MPRRVMSNDMFNGSLRDNLSAEKPHPFTAV
jgi:hypothetical protein